MAVCKASEGLCNVANDVCKAARAICNVAHTRCKRAHDGCKVANAVCNVANDDCNRANRYCRPANIVCSPANSVCNLANSVCNLADSVCNLADSVCNPVSPLFYPHFVTCRPYVVVLLARLPVGDASYRDVCPANHVGSLSHTLQGGTLCLDSPDPSPRSLHWPWWPRFGGDLHRYAIVNETDLRDGSARVVAGARGERGQRTNKACPDRVTAWDAGQNGRCSDGGAGN
jgi:hypothetical protein